MPASTMSTHLLSSALLGIVEQAGLGVVTLIENLERDELLRSRLTRYEVQRQLKTLGRQLPGKSSRPTAASCPSWTGTAGKAWCASLSTLTP